jgi:hypothetical protein
MANENTGGTVILQEHLTVSNSEMNTADQKQKENPVDDESASSSEHARVKKSSEDGTDRLSRNVGT